MNLRLETTSSRKNKYFYMFLTVLTICAVSTYAFATPPSTPYTPGQTLDPTCAPGSSNCIVQSGGTPATPLNGIQYNNAGVFGADANFTRDPVTQFTNIAAPFIAPSDFVAGGGNTGINDVSVVGIPTAGVGETLTITIDIGDPTSPNVFNWADSLGGSGLHVAMAGGAITLPGSVGNWVIQWNNITGHVSGDTFVSTMDAVTGGLSVGNFMGGGYFSGSQWIDPASGVSSLSGVGSIPGILNNGSIFATIGGSGDAHLISNFQNGIFSFEGGTSNGSNRADFAFGDGTFSLTAGNGTYNSGFSADWKAARFQSHNTQFVLPDAWGAAGSVMTDVLGNGVFSMQTSAVAPIYPSKLMPFGDGTTHGGVTTGVTNGIFAALDDGNGTFLLDNTAHNVQFNLNNSTFGAGILADFVWNGDSLFTIDGSGKNVTMGDLTLGSGGNNTLFQVNDSTQKYVFNKLGGSGTRMITTDNSGILGTAAIPVSPITIQNTTSLFSTGVASITSGATYANFFGYGAGNGATSADQSNFFGLYAGYHATGAASSNFFGASAGFLASGAGSSNFIGNNAGNGATNASFSNFIGYQAGDSASSAANSIFIGYNAGNNDTSTGNSILIGNSTSTGTSCTGIGCSNSIALGNYATNTAANQLMIGSTGSPINDLVIIGQGFQTCSVNTGTGFGISCSSDQRLKTNITDLATNTLDTLSKVRTVNFNWNSNPTGPQNIGFLAQDIQQYYPQLVSTAANGYLQVNYAGITPVLVESIRELNLKLTNIQNFATSSDTTFLTTITNWLASATNGIKDFFATKVHTKELCVGDSSQNETCITKSQLDQLLQNQNGSVTISSGGSSTPTTDTSSPTSDTTQTSIVTPPVITPDLSTQTPTVTDPTVTVTPSPTDTSSTSTPSN